MKTRHVSLKLSVNMMVSCLSRFGQLLYCHLGERSNEKAKIRWLLQLVCWRNL